MAKRKKGAARGRWLGGFLAGLFVGLALALWVFPRLTQWWSNPSPDVVAGGPSASPRFDFYEILERGEQVVEETRTTPQTAPTPSAEAVPQPSGEPADQPSADPPDRPRAQPQAPSPVAAPGMYVLQLGAFTRQQEAESMKARLALVGMNARVQPVRVDRQTYFRVRIGPTDDLAQLNADRARLREHRFDSILLKLVQ